MNDTEHSQLLKSLAEKNRLRIIRLLSYEELNVQEICQITKETQPKISRNLAILKNIGLVSDRRDGVKIYYSLQLDSPSYQHLSSYIDSLKKSPHEDLNDLKLVLKKRTLESKIFSTKIASNWDKLANSLHNPIINTLDIIKFFIKDYTIVDLGCGTGALLPVLSKISEKVYALDHSQEMLDRAREKATTLGLNNINFLQADFIDDTTNIPSADIYILHHVLHQIASPNILLQNLSKKIHQDGFIIIIDLVAHNNEKVQKKFGSIWSGFSKKQLANWLESAQLNILQWQTKNALDNKSDIEQFITIIKK